MRPRTVNRIAVSLIVLVVGAFGFLGLAIAKADDVEKYLEILRDRGIWATTGDGTLVRAGLEVCDLIELGRTPQSVAAQVYRETDASISAGDAGYIVGAAIGGLCPEYAGLIP